MSEGRSNRRLYEWLRLEAERAERDQEARELAGGGAVGSEVEWTDREGRIVDRGEIARGGMGTVHRAEDTRLMREVAMKRMLEPMSEPPDPSVRLFVDEAQITGQLEHPNIPPVHDIGVDAQGRAYFTMKLVRGTSFYQWLWHPSRAPGSPARLGEGLEIFMKICDAVSFAHSRGVIHRDLKPANVMVGPFGEVYVMDWGLARVAGFGVDVSHDEDDGRARSFGGAVGTPCYMSPEQARGRNEDCDERTDVFGLGAILYEIVTGEPPYPPKLELPALHAAAAKGSYVPPEEVLGDIGVSGRILRTLKRALSRDREDRHQSAAELKNDVQGFLRGGLHLPRQAFAPGTRIVVEGEAGETLYIIVRGECVAYKTNAETGEKRTLRRMGPGDVFGEMAALTEMPRSATVEAVDVVTTLVVTRRALEEGLGIDSWLGTLVKVLIHRFRELDERMHRE